MKISIRFLALKILEALGLKPTIKQLFLKALNLLEVLGLRATQTESPARLLRGNAMRIHSLSVLTDLAVRNVGRHNIREYTISNFTQY